MGDPIRGRSLPELRRLAIDMGAKGIKRGKICAELGVAPSTAWRWLKQHREQGDAMIDRKVGRPAHLSPEQTEVVIEKLLLGPTANGYDTPLWTLARIAETIRSATGVSFSTCYVSTLMRGLGWSCQKPARRAKERNADAIAGWVRDEWPCLKKKPRISTPR